MYRKLPEEVRKQARASYQLFRQNPNHPSLHFKCIGQRVPMYSARVGIGQLLLKQFPVLWLKF